MHLSTISALCAFALPCLAGPVALVPKGNEVSAQLIRYVIQRSSSLY